jgi:hypothetical protein
MRAVIDRFPLNQHKRQAAYMDLDDARADRHAMAFNEHHRDNSALVRKRDVPFRTAGND